MSKRITPEAIDAILPQTQCTLCGYNGCLPYAKAIVHDNASPALCEPGGVETLMKVGKLLNKDITPFIDSVRAKEKPLVIASIQEDTCIGCVKCIKACPVDAIIGAAKQMHTVVSDACTGCELCIPVCPVDCIDLLPATDAQVKANASEEKRALFRKRHQDYLARQEQTIKTKRLHSPKTSQNKSNDYVLNALARVKAKKATLPQPVDSNNPIKSSN